MGSRAQQDVARVYPLPDDPERTWRTSSTAPTTPRRRAARPPRQVRAASSSSPARGFEALKNVAPGPERAACAAPPCSSCSPSGCSSSSRLLVHPRRPRACPARYPNAQGARRAPKRRRAACARCPAQRAPRSRVRAARAHRVADRPRPSSRSSLHAERALALTWVRTGRVAWRDDDCRYVEHVEPPRGRRPAARSSCWRCRSDRREAR